MSVHLDKQSLESLLDGGMSLAQERRLSRHLQEDCPQCQDFLESMPEEKEAELMRILIRTQESGSALPVMPAELLPTKRFRIFSGRPWLVPAFSLAVLVLCGWAVSLAFMTWSQEQTTFRSKGSVMIERPTVELTVGRLHKTADGQSEIERLANGAALAGDSQLVFKLEVGGPCYLYLLRMAEHRFELLVPADGQSPLHHPGGTFLPELAGQPASFALKGLAGNQHFVALCAPAPLSVPADLESLTQSLAEQSPPAPGLRMVSLDRVAIRVIAQGGEP